MLTLYNQERVALRAFENIISATDNYVEYERNGFRTRIYANIGAGEFFADSEEMEAELLALQEVQDAEETDAEETAVPTEDDDLDEDDGLDEEDDFADDIEEGDDPDDFDEVDEDDAAGEDDESGDDEADEA